MNNSAGEGEAQKIVWRNVFQDLPKEFIGQIRETHLSGCGIYTRVVSCLQSREIGISKRSGKV
jgi:hypothetical protein